MKTTTIFALIAGLLFTASVAKAEFTLIGPPDVQSLSLFIGSYDEYESQEAYEGLPLVKPSVPYARFFGLAVGLAHETFPKDYKMGVSGIQGELIANINQDCRGIFGSGLFNSVTTLAGIQGALGISMADEVNGIQASLLCSSTLDYSRGIQASLLTNLGSGCGLQVACFNATDDSEDAEYCGLQVGLFNYSAHLKGVQIGLININANGILFPLINIGW